ncbi:MAG TPA: rRNA maturation RNase YbeY [Anaerolineae bacterium]|nr:rRNA maturation RNase YbeY [Anaerolineae bacterium]
MERARPPAKAKTSKSPAARIETQVAARYRARVKQAALRNAAQAVLVQQHVQAGVELTIVITGNAQLRSLNRTFRDVDAPTDVLSFATDERLRPDTVYLGDVVISYPQAQAQAKAGGHSVLAELQLLVVHGVLHLLGHDHYTEAEKNAMWKAQAAILKKLATGITGPKF